MPDPLRYKSDTRLTQGLLSPSGAGFVSGMNGQCLKNGQNLWFQNPIPSTCIALFGSYARGDSRHDSDIDLLVLLNKEQVTRQDQKMIKYSPYDLEFDSGIIISPLILSKKDWEEKRKKTPFYENVLKEGVEI